MSESVFEFGTYNVFEVGKMIKASKKKHVWKLKIDGAVFEIRVLESVMSSKFRVMVQDRIIYDHRSTEDAKRFGLDLVFQGNSLFIKKFSDNRYELQINGQKFLPRCTRRLQKYASAMKPSAETLVRPTSLDLRSLTPEETKAMSKEWQERHEDFLDYDKKEQVSDDEMFAVDDEVTVNRVESSQFEFGESSESDVGEKFLTDSVYLVPPPNQQILPHKLEIRMKKKEQPAVEESAFGNFLDFEFGVDKRTDQPQEAKQLSQSNLQKSKTVSNLFGDDDGFESAQEDLTDFYRLAGPPASAQQVSFPPRGAVEQQSNLFEEFEMALSSSLSQASPPPKPSSAAPVRRDVQPTLANDPFAEFTSEIDLNPVVTLLPNPKQTTDNPHLPQPRSANRLDDLSIPNVDFSQLILGETTTDKGSDPFMLMNFDEQQNLQNEFRNGLTVGERRRAQDDFLL